MYSQFRGEVVLRPNTVINAGKYFPPATIFSLIPRKLCVYNVVRFLAQVNIGKTSVIISALDDWKIDRAPYSNIFHFPVDGLKTPWFASMKYFHGDETIERVIVSRGNHRGR